MAALSVSVMAHPRRADLVNKLVARLGVDHGRVTWDQRGDRWDTGRRAWLDHDPDADWHLVVQDDALVCADLPDGLAKALDHVSEAAVVSLYVGTLRPARSATARLVAQARRERPSWLVTSTLAWGVAIAAPTSSIPGMVAWCDQLTYPQYDRRIAAYYRDRLGWETWHTWPSLVDHHGGRSLIGHAAGRRAHEFAGEDASALALTWDGGVLRAPGDAGPVVPRRYANHRREEAATMTQPTRRQRIRGYVEQRRRLHRPGGPTPQPAAQPAGDAYDLAVQRQESYQEPEDTRPAESPAASEPPPEPTTEPAVQPEVVPVEVDQGSAPPAESAATPEPPPRSGKGSGATVWREYLTSLGIDPADLDGLSKGELIELYDQR